VGFQRENVGKLGEEPWINHGKLAGADWNMAGI
jgi:hypothetical protein